jgi:hypothetical protein
LRARWRAFFSRPALRTLSSTSSSWALVWSRLKSHISQLTEERLAAGPAWSDSGYLFTTEVGEPLRPATVSLAFERAVGRAKVPAIRLQDLRHVSATLALLAGVPVHVVSARLGHADPAITLRVYSHCLPTSQRDARPESALRSTAPGWCCLPKVCHRATKPDIRREGRSVTAQRLQGIRRSGPLRMHLTSGQGSQLMS